MDVSGSGSSGVTHISFSTRGGAGSVAKLLVRGQVEQGMQSRFLSVTESGVQSLVGREPALVAEALFDFFVVRKDIHGQLFTLYRNIENQRVKNLVRLGTEVVHLHWTPGVLSIETVGLVAKRGSGCVWTLHDMWPFTGGCHHAGDCLGFTSGCQRCPQVRGLFKESVDRAFQRKLKEFDKTSALGIVSPSKWLANQAAKSEIFSNVNIHVIPNPIDASLFSPGDKWSARERFEIPESAFVVGCGAVNLNDPMKNLNGIIEGVEALRELFPDKELFVLAIGGGTLNSSYVKIQTTGMLTVQNDLVNAYRAMDVFVSMSLQENLPMTLIEASSVGVPTVCLNVGGMSEIVVNGENGKVLNSSSELPNALIELISDSHERQRMSLSARSLILKKFALPKVLNRYSEVYGSVREMGL